MQFEDIKYLPENLAQVEKAYEEDFEQTMVKIHDHVRQGTTLYYSQYYFGGGLIRTPYSIAVVYTEPSGKAVVVGILSFTYTSIISKLDNVHVAKSIRVMLSPEELEMVQNIELFMSYNMELVFPPVDNNTLNARDIQKQIDKHLKEQEMVVNALTGDSPEAVAQARHFNRVTRARVMRSIPKMIRNEIKGY